uniref:Small ribosomal subunit protein mS23 n=1 Tax=Magallana gigas TaxID=29159 RepID=K1PSU9_MAGGI
MASSRGQFIGTIYTRTQGLIRSGAMRREKIPLWFNIYEAFPPLDKFNAEEKEPDQARRIKRINYPEDLIRVKFYERYGTPEVVNLESNIDTLSQKFAKYYIANKNSMLKENPGLSESKQTEDRLKEGAEGEPTSEDTPSKESQVQFEDLLRVFSHDHNLKMSAEDIRRQKKRQYSLVHRAQTLAVYVALSRPESKLEFDEKTLLKYF